MCNGRHTHVVLQGSLTNLSAQYPPGLCAEFTGAIAYNRRLAGVFPIDDDVADRRRGALESMAFYDA